MKEMRDALEKGEINLVLKHVVTMLFRGLLRSETPLSLAHSKRLISDSVSDSCLFCLARIGGTCVSAPHIKVERVFCAVCRRFYRRARLEGERGRLVERETGFKQNYRFCAVLGTISYRARSSLCLISSGLVTSLFSPQRTFASGLPLVSETDSDRREVDLDQAWESSPICTVDKRTSSEASCLSVIHRGHVYRKGDRCCNSADGVGCLRSASFFSAYECSWPRCAIVTKTSDMIKREHLLEREGYRDPFVSAFCNGSLSSSACIFTSTGRRSWYESSNTRSVFQRSARHSYVAEILIAHRMNSILNSGNRENRGSRNRVIERSRRSRSGCMGNCTTPDTPSFRSSCTACCSSRSSRIHSSSTDSDCKKVNCTPVDDTNIRFVMYNTLCRKRLRTWASSRRSWNRCGARCRWNVHPFSVGVKVSPVANAIHAASHSFRPSPSTPLCACAHRYCPSPGMPAATDISSVYPSLSPLSPPPFWFSSRASSTPPLGGQACAASRRTPPPSAISPQAATDSDLPSATAMPQFLSPEAFYGGEFEEEDTPGEFTHALWMSDVPTQERARLWLKLPVATAADADDSAKGAGQPPTLAGEGAARVLSISNNTERRARYGGAWRGEQQHWEHIKHQSAFANTEVNEEVAVEAQEKLREEYEEFGQTHVDNESDDFLSPLEGEWNPHPLYSRSRRRSAAATVSPGSTLLSRLAIAEREALLSIPRTAKRNKENNELVGIGGEVYPSMRIRRAVLSQERLGAAIGDDLQRLAFDRRQMPTSLRSGRRRQCLRLADRGRYQDTDTEDKLLDHEGISRKRMRVLDLDSVPVAVLHHSFMFLLVKHLPAEICMKVISRIATYRDIHTQLAYENLIRDLGFLLTKQYETCTAIPHSLGPTFIAYLSRILQTLSIAWSVDYIRRYGCFSKKFIAHQIERSTSPRLFDCVRYEKHGGVKPLPPIITHPHRLSSYVRLLDESSAKFYMYTHLKRHGQIPMQHQLQHRLAAQGHLETGETQENVTPFQTFREYGACTAGQGDPAISAATLTAPREGESVEMEHRLPRPFVAAEKLLQPIRASQRSSSHSCLSGRRSDKTQTLGRQGGRERERGRARPLAEHQSGTPAEVEGKGGPQERDGYRNLRNGIPVITKRPKIYDLILAAEHMGLDYRQLQKDAVSQKTVEREPIQKEGGNGETSAAAFNKEVEDVCSDEEEDPDEAELRELLIDDGEIYRHILHKYILRKSGTEEGRDPAPGSEGKADGIHEDEVFCKTEDEGANDYGSDTGLAQERRLQEERWRRTSFPVAAATTEGEIVCVRTRDAPAGGSSAHNLTHAGNEHCSICEECTTQGEADSNDSSSSCNTFSDTEKRMQDSCERLTTKYTVAEDPLDRELSTAAGTAAESSVLVNDADLQKQGSSAVLPPVGCFAANCAIPRVHHNPLNASALPSIEDKNSAIQGTTHNGTLYRSEAVGCTRSEAGCGNAERMGEKRSSLNSTRSSAANTETSGWSEEGNDATRPDNDCTVENGAAVRMQNTFVATLEWMDRGRVRRTRRDKKAAAAENALLPCTRDHDGEAQWGWPWNFTVDKSDGPSAHKGLEEEGCAATGGTSERWWRTSWGRNRAFFRFKGNSYALIPGQGWKQVNAGPSQVLKPKKRNCRHELKRGRRRERKVRLRRVREEILRQELDEALYTRKASPCV